MSEEKDLKQMENEYRTERNKIYAKRWEKQRKWYFFLQIIYSMLFGALVCSFSYFMHGMEAVREFGYWQALLWQNFWLLTALMRWLIEEKNYNKIAKTIEAENAN